MKIEYFAGGVIIDEIEHEAIVCGKRDKLIRCPEGQPCIPICVLTDTIRVDSGKLDKDDPVLKAALEIMKLPLEKVYVIQRYEADPNSDPLSQPRSLMYGYW